MHTKKQGTCSITFKKALAGQLLEAWRILRRASMDRVLLSFAPAPVVVFGAGSATPDTAVDHVNFDDADLGEIESELEDEQPSTAYFG